jgi:hypothetical protein
MGLRLYAKVFQNDGSHKCGTIDITEDELATKLKEGISIKVACDDIRRFGHCSRGDHNGRIEISLLPPQ